MLIFLYVELPALVSRAALWSAYVTMDHATRIDVGSYNFIRRVNPKGQRRDRTGKIKCRVQTFAEEEAM